MPRHVAALFTSVRISCSILLRSSHHDLQIGVNFESGTVVPKDDRLAVEWYTKSAEQGNVSAQFNLGGMYSNGRGVPKDDRLATEWYRKAAAQGDEMALNNLGVRYNKGIGVLKNTLAAYALYNIAAAAGNDTAVRNRSRLEPEMNPSYQAACTTARTLLP